METLGSLKGNTTVRISGESVGNALYHIQVVRDGGRLMGVGTLQASALVVQEVASVQSVELELGGARVLKVYPTSCDALVGQVIFRTGGTIPGFDVTGLADGGEPVSAEPGAVQP